MTPRREAIAVVVWLLVGCGDDGGAGVRPDGSMQDAGAIVHDIPWYADGAPPIAPPMLTPCPAGWREVPAVDASGVATCDPYPESGALECAASEAHFPGEPGCTPIGSPCPAGEWADGLPSDGTVLYVRPGSMAVLGTREAPFGRISDAMMVARDGTTIALAKGRYTEEVRMRAGVTLRGACAAETILAPARNGILALMPRAHVADLTVAGSTEPGIIVSGAGASLEVDGVLLVDAQVVATLVEEGASLTARRLVIRDSHPASDGNFGVHLMVTSGARADVSYAVLERGTSAGIVAGEAGSHIAASDIVVRDTAARPLDQTQGRGIVAQSGASVVVQRVLVERSDDVGAYAHGPGTQLALENAVVRESLAAGATIVVGSSATFSRALFDRNAITNVGVEGDGTTATLADVVLRDALPRPLDRGFGRGLVVQYGARATAERIVIERSREVALAILVGADLALADAVIRDTLSQESDGTLGRGIAVQDSVLTASRLVVERSHDIGVFTAGPSASVTGTDVVVRDTLPRVCAATTCPDFPVGHGAVLSIASHTSLERFVVSRSHMCGLMLAREGQADARIGEIAENRVGVCVQVDGYDTNRLTDRVVFRENQSAIEATTLPVPDVTMTELP